MLTWRLLPRGEWHRLAGTELEGAEHILPDDAEVLVIEDAGKIVGCWSAMRYWHVEGVWIAPSHRKSVGVARKLLAVMRELLRSRGARAAITGATTPDVRQLLTEHLGATELPGSAFVWPLSKRRRR